MRCPYAVVGPCYGSDSTTKVLSVHTQLFHALAAVKNTKYRDGSAQVRELAAPVVVGERIHYTHLRRWD